MLFAPARSFTLSPEGPARSGGPLLPYSLTHCSLLTRFSYPSCAVIQIGSLDSNLYSPYSLRVKTSDPATPGIDR